MPDEHVFVITGAAGGMGLASARALASEGQLLLTDVREEDLRTAERALAAQGARVHTLRCDVTSEEDVAAVADTVRSIGRFRALVHTAGLSPVMADGRRVLNVDLCGSVRITDALFPLVEPGSSAVLVASIAGYNDVDPPLRALLDAPLAEGFVDEVERVLGQPVDGATAYMLAKYGVLRLAERLAAPWGGKGGRTVSISPGIIDTDMGRLELEHQPMMPAMIEMTPVKRPGLALPGLPEDIAAAVAFLVSDAAAFVSGCDLRVDGGLIGAGRSGGLGA